MAQDTPTAVAFLGPEASYTHQAAQKAYPNTTTFTPFPTIPSLFTAIQSRAATIAICPIENSTNGPVAATLDLFADPTASWRAVRAVAEVRVPVRHCLLVHAAAQAPTSPPRFGTDEPDPALRALLARLATLHTHPQAWGQCSKFLAWLDALRAADAAAPARRLDATSTSRAAAIVARDVPAPGAEEIAPATDTLGAGERLDECAAISSAATLALHPGKLRIALTGLEDSAANVTRFVVLAHEDAVGGVGGKGAGVLGVEEEGKGRVKALLAFSLAEEGQKAPAGALAKSLAVLARHRLDMTSIAARPSGRAAWDYVFVVEVEVPQDGGRDGWGLVEEALKDVRDVAGEARCCGLWRFDESEGL